MCLWRLNRQPQVRWLKLARGCAGPVARRRQLSSVPAVLEEVFELNMQLEGLRMSRKMEEDDLALIRELQAHKTEFEKKFEVLTQELKQYWDQWDRVADVDQEEKRHQVRDKMVDVLNRRSYIRNLVRDVNEALGS